jgi:hypothetical protein
MTYIEKLPAKPLLRTLITAFKLLLFNLHAQLWLLANPDVILPVCLSDTYANIITVKRPRFTPLGTGSQG